MALPPGGERRRSQRQTVNKPGSVLAPGLPPIPCTILNASTGGAGIEWKGNQVLPDSFTLMLPDMTKRSCRVIWRSNPPQKRAGVRFA